LSDEHRHAEHFATPRLLAFLEATNQARAWLDKAWRLGLKLLLHPLYQLYELHLSQAVTQDRVPRHIGIILDGNRRHGRARGVTDFRRIYDLGAGKLDGVLDWCAGIGVPAVTLWVCSTDNLARPEAEVSGIFGAIETKMRALAADPRVHSLGVRVQAIGRLDLLPESLVDALEAAGRATADNTRITLTIAAGYGGREEVADAVRALLNSGAAQGLSPEEIASMVSPEAIGRHLYMPALPDLDLIIRTSGEVRISGFMLWQSIYSELYFADVNWPDFRRVDLLRAVRSYQGRQRRFGR
jgi:short-chain Z-isoprenyl diphosphate synthase